MSTHNLLDPLFKTIDKIIFGFEEIKEAEDAPFFKELDTEEEFDVERSSN